MKRLLLIGKELPRLESIDWNSCLTHNIVDYQGLLFDCRKIGDFSLQGNLLPGILQHYLPAGHSIYIIAPDLKDSGQNQTQLHILPHPFTFTVQRAEGRTVKLLHKIPFFEQYMDCLQGHEIIIERNVTNLPQLTPTIVDNLGRMVCGLIQASNGRVFLLHPPAKAKESEAFRIVVNDFKPDFIEPEPEAPPEWASTIIANLPGISEIDKSVAELKGRVTSLESQIDSHLKQKQQIEKWAELLWLDGIALQNRVREAFDFLGFHTESPNPTGHTHDLLIQHETYTFYTEITGATGSIKIDKGRELMHWLIDATVPVRGILIGNAFRNNPPAERPPSANHKIFTADLEQFANQRDFALLETKELLKLVAAKLENKSPDLQTICERLSGKGVVTLIDQRQTAV